MRRKIGSLLLALLLGLGLALPALAEEEGLEHFTRSAEPGVPYTDVTEDDWFASVVADARALGLMQGREDGSFDPEGSVTLAETLALACRLNDIYHGGSGVFEQGDPWYAVYVEEAIARGILGPSEEEADYNAPAPRRRFAELVRAAFPDDALEPINIVEQIPDVDGEADWVDSVLLLYRAGVLTGNDAFGTFTPDKSIRRCEVAAIVSRMADPALRRSFSLVPEPHSTVARWLDANGTDEYWGFPALHQGIEGDDYYFYAAEDEGRKQLRLSCAVDPGQTEDYDLFLELRLLRDGAGVRIYANLMDADNTMVTSLTAESGRFTSSGGSLSVDGFWSREPISASYENSLRRNMKALAEVCVRNALDWADQELRNAGFDGLAELGYPWE